MVTYNVSLKYQYQYGINNQRFKTALFGEFEQRFEWSREVICNSKNHEEKERRSPGLSIHSCALVSGCMGLKSSP